jgi:simple sugar transport system ATP-binding protein
VSDRITVMRNGEREGEYLARELPVDLLVAKMVGREPVSGTLQAGAAAVQRDAGASAPFLSMQRAGRRGMMSPLDLDVRPGEIVGLAGLLGSGRTETARLAFGAERTDTGAIEIDGRRARLASPHDAVRNGIAYCPRTARRRASSPRCRFARTSCSRCRRGAAGG